MDQHSSPSRPNILLITTDQQRYDTLGVTGNEFIHTPHLDVLARRGTLFEHCIIQNPVCIPSRACMQTGRYTHQHGVRYMETVIDTTPGLPEWETTFMERLQQSGYRTAAFGKIHMMPPKGFDELQLTGGKGQRWTQSEGLPIGPGPLGPYYAAWLEERDPGAYERIYEQRRTPEYKQLCSALPNVLPTDEVVDHWIAENTLEFLSRDHDQPFFVWCGFCGPHGPFDPPEPYASMYAPEEVPIPPTYLADTSNKPPFQRGAGGRFRREPDDSLIRRIISYYYGLCTLIDDEVGRILQVMEQRGLLDNTLIIFTSDHGEMLGEFGMMGKGNFYESVIRVPTIVVPPGAKANRSRISDVVEVFDLAATILDYAGCQIPDSMEAKSWRPLLDGEGAGKECALCEYTNNDQTLSGKCLRTERYSYAYWGVEQGEEFYDLVDDPLQLRNLATDPAYRHLVDEHRLLLLDKLMNSERPIVTDDQRQFDWRPLENQPVAS